LLNALLESLVKIEYNPLEIIVVDNGSSDDTASMLESYRSKVTYIRNNQNIGVSARNIGLKNAKGSMVITLDDDVLGINDSHIRILAGKFTASPRLAAVNFKVIDPSTGKLCNWVHHRDPLTSSGKEFLTYEITEGAVAFRMEALRRVGFYSEDFFLSHEGPDLALRMLDAGYDVIYSDLVSVLHYRSNLGRKNWLKYYFDTRNQFWLAARNFPVPYAAEYLFRGLSSMLFYSLRDGYLKYWLRAVRDGLRGIPDVLCARNVLNAETMKKVRAIDSERPALASLIKERFLRKGVRL
jgi:GT2 family glycosyltransferase